MRYVKPLLTLHLLVVLVTGATAQTNTVTPKRGITPEDYYAFEFLSDPHLSPDGSQVAYVVTTVSQRQNRRNSTIWLVAADGSSKPRQLTVNLYSSSSPRWSPDGKQIAFISSRPASADSSEAPRPQIYLLHLNGGEPQRVSNFKNGASSFQWSPDGKRLACLVRTGPSDALDDKNRLSDVRHYKTIQYKFNDTGWYDDKRAHIWVIDLAKNDAKLITGGQDWNDADIQWSPDSKTIAFTSDRTGRAYEDSRNTDVWTIPAEGGQLTKISDHAEADSSPRWSPDGKQIAFISNAHESSHPKIFLTSSAGSAASSLAVNNLDLIPGNLTWAEAGKSLYFDTGVRGEYHIYRVDVTAKSLKKVTTGSRAVRNFDINDKTGKIVYTVNDFKHLDDLYIADLNGGNEKKLTNLNAALWDKLELMDVERLTYKGADGWDIDGFLVKPRGFTPGTKYPMILNIHGGPAGMYGVDWFHEFQVYAARGWAVFYTNPRGSTGYGEQFERGIKGEWGGKDYVDVMNGVEAVLQKYDWIDRNRLGVTGGSYGGFMTNWIVGHTDIFKAAVTLRSLSNFISDEGTRDGAYGHKRDFGGDLFEKFDLYWERSPLKYANKVKTPTLILHSDNDFRVPLEQGEQWFRALKKFGVTTEMVMFPRENHNLTRTGEPKHLVESLNWQIYWFDRFLNNNQAAVPPDVKTTEVR
jgi:dipeptidyl aminopeptidase/acylaminoacyl peptidase